MDGLVDKNLINEQLIKPLLLYFSDSDIYSKVDLLTKLKDETITSFELDTARTLDETILSILSGDTAFIIDGIEEALIISSRGWKSRGIEEPQTESVIRGLREGFTEDIRTNTAASQKIARPLFKT